MSTEQYLLEAENDTRKLWSILNEVVDRKQLKLRIPEKFNINGRCVTQPTQIANAFNSYFASISSQMANSIPAQEGYKSYLRQSYGSFQLAKPHESVVMGIMKKQQPKLSCGVDTINNKLVKHCCKELALPMALIIDLSIEEATVPKKLKIARIIPL